MKRRKSKYGYFWITLALFGLSIAGHWGFGWAAYANEAREHGQPAEMRGYLIEMARDTLENWQSEFLQLIWQVGGLAVLWHVGSPSSKESGDRLEEKVDYLLDRIDGGAAKRQELDVKYPRK